jgi:hypothetical protein
VTKQYRSWVPEERLRETCGSLPELLSADGG